MYGPFIIRRRERGGNFNAAKRFIQTAASAALASSSTINVLGKDYVVDSMTNITPSITNRLSQKLLCIPSSPLALLWRRIQRHFDETFPLERFEYFKHDEPVVSVQQNFDELLISPSHPSRSPNESYFINRNHMLRTHMTAHEREVMAMGKRRFLLVGDVYRRDEIDSSHMPVFHQMEGVRIFSPEELLCKEKTTLRPLPIEIEKIVSEEQLQANHDPKIIRLLIADLYFTLDGLMRNLFGKVQTNWQRTFFPFTQPSLEAEIFHDGRWLELFGSGILQNSIIHSKIIERHPNAIGWAFGMGLERVAMILYGIPDIRLFWSKDERFSNQFLTQNDTDKPVPFVPFSKYPPIVRDISFFPPKDEEFNPNSFYELIREAATPDDDLVECVKLIDEYKDGKSGRKSLCYRITFRATDRTLTDDHVNAIQAKIRQSACLKLGLVLR